MKAFLSAALAASFFALPALAQDAPKPSRGFQMAIRTGVQLPFGRTIERFPSAFEPANPHSVANLNTAMSETFSPQVPIHLEIGGKPIPHLFVGGYLGLGFGGAAGYEADACGRANLTCVAANLRFGVELQYHIRPAEMVNPWIGYGIGIEGSSLRGDSSTGQYFRYTLVGVEFAHFMSGLDFRLTRGIGIGPVVDFAIGQYLQASAESNRLEREGDLAADERATHFWLTLGGRVVIFP